MVKIFLEPREGLKVLRRGVGEAFRSWELNKSPNISWGSAVSERFFRVAACVGSNESAEELKE